MENLKIITGVFFQSELSNLDWNNDKYCIATNIPIDIARFSFHGTIWQNTELIAEGVCNDFFGYSKLANIKIGSALLSFDKQYLHKEYIINYIFHLQKENIWYGSYKSPYGAGTCRCILNSVDTTFFLV